MKRRVAFRIFQLAGRLNDTDSYILHCCNWAQIGANVSPERNMQERFWSTLIKKNTMFVLVSQIDQQKAVAPNSKNRSKSINIV